MSLFVANKVLIFSDLSLYSVTYTPPPRFWHSHGGSALFQNFFIFLFFIFLFTRYKVSVLSFEWLCSRFRDTFRYLDYLQIRLDVWLFVCLYSLSCCRFLFRLILNRKLWGIFEFSLAPLRKRPIFLLFVFSPFLLYWYFKLKKKQKRKIRFFAVFA